MRSEIKTERVVFFKVGGVTEKALLFLLPNEGFKKLGHHFRLIVPELVQIVTNLEPNIIAQCGISIVNPFSPFPL